ncbi:MAG: peptide chain release factor N(5)-glutamine methyltransferase [Candidatus Omnitrophica bacterium]|nr:peptide chain release factor N(5)-glutamine methyltransferase [Candidatus Omnitrophota bacterium]
MATASAQRIIQEGIARLQAVGMGHVRHEVEWLLSRLVGARPLELYLRDAPIPTPTVERFFSQIDARAAGIPLQYLLGEAEFFGERFAVSPGVFIPRPETEVIVDAALGFLRERERRLGRPLQLLDLGTGTGCIAVTLARALPTCVVVGVEVSWVALRAARQNVHRHGLSARIRLVQGRWGAPLRGGFDGLIANPPSVPSGQVDHLPLDVRREPRVSLDGGPDGMRELASLMEQAPRLVRGGGVVAFECGEDEVSELVRAASAASWVEAVAPIRDLSNRPRGALIHLR